MSFIVTLFYDFDFNSKHFSKRQIQMSKRNLPFLFKSHFIIALHRRHIKNYCATTIKHKMTDVMRQFDSNSYHKKFAVCHGVKRQLLLIHPPKKYSCYYKGLTSVFECQYQLLSSVKLSISDNLLFHLASINGWFSDIMYDFNKN